MANDDKLAGLLHDLHTGEIDWFEASEEAPDVVIRRDGENAVQAVSQLLRQLGSVEAGDDRRSIVALNAYWALVHANTPEAFDALADLVLLPFDKEEVIVPLFEMAIESPGLRAHRRFVANARDLARRTPSPAIAEFLAASGATAS
jgi:hypothetical protein